MTLSVPRIASSTPHPQDSGLSRYEFIISVLLSPVISWCIQSSVQNIKMTRFEHGPVASSVLSDAFPDLYPLSDAEQRPREQDDYDGNVDQENNQVVVVEAIMMVKTG